MALGRLGYSILLALEQQILELESHLWNSVIVTMNKKARTAYYDYGPDQMNVIYLFAMKYIYAKHKYND